RVFFGDPRTVFRGGGQSERACKSRPFRVSFGGAERARTADLVNAIHAPSTIMVLFDSPLVYYVCIMGPRAAHRRQTGPTWVAGGSAMASGDSGGWRRRTAGSLSCCTMCRPGGG